MNKKKITYVITLGFLVSLMGLTLVGCNKKPVYSESPTTRKVKTQTIDGQSHVDKITVSGNVAPTEIVRLSYKLAGVISEVYPKEGDFVEKGQLISALDSSDYKIQMNAAQADQSIADAGIGASQAQLESGQEEYEAAKLQVETEIPSKTKQAESQLNLTQTTYDRIEVLHEAGAVPTSQFDEISTKLEVDKETYQQALDAKAVAEAKLRASQKKLDAVKAQIEIASAQSQKAGTGIELASSQIADTSIYSPINGVILKKIMTAGETTSAGHPVVAIGKTDQVWVEIGVSDQYINQLQKGQKAIVNVYGVDQVLEGVIDEIASLADTTTRTFSVKILLDNYKGLLKPGMIGKVDIYLNNNAITLIPLSSVIHLNEGAFIFIYDEETETVQRKNITTGVIVGDQIQVLEGLEQGQEIVTEGQFVLRDNDPVTVYQEEITND